VQRSASADAHARHARTHAPRRTHAGAYFSGRTLSSGEEVFPLSASVDGHAVHLSRAPPLKAYVTPEALPPDLAPYLHLDASGAPAAQ
jgi:hypothetical protein